MFFPDKQPTQCSDRPDSSEESIKLQVFNMSETGPVEHTKVPLGQRFSKPIQCTEPPSVVEQGFSSCCVLVPERTLSVITAFNDPAPSTMQDLLPISSVITNHCEQSSIN